MVRRSCFFVPPNASIEQMCTVIVSVVAVAATETGAREVRVRGREEPESLCCRQLPEFVSS